jgi:snoRNA binding domain, fibrillarin
MPHAGSLTNLAKAPASTVQILGAEKALFRALKTKGNTPKYGLIFHSTFIGRAKQRNKGRISRYLANKCSIATRIDAFMDNATPIFGEKMRDQARLARLSCCFPPLSVPVEPAADLQAPCRSTCLSKLWCMTSVHKQRCAGGDSSVSFTR